MGIWQYFDVRYHSGLYTMQEPPYLRKIALVSIWFRMASGIQRFSDLEIYTKYEYLTVITILTPMGRFFDTMIDVDFWYHAFTYIPDQYWLSPVFCAYHFFYMPVGKGFDTQQVKAKHTHKM